MQAWSATLLAVAVVSLVSLVGAVALTLPGLRSHRLLLVLVAVAAGTLLGDALLHVLPEAVEAWEGRGVAAMAPWILVGFVSLFLLEVALRARHAHAEAGADHHAAAHTGHGHAHAEAPVAPYAWTNLLGDAVHNLLDGAVIAAAFRADAGLGVATAIAVVIHEVPQELGDFAVLLRAGLSPRRALAFNFASAGAAFVGAGTVLALPAGGGVVEAYGLPLIMGAFLYIAAADLVPELHHHSRGREAILILASFLVGLAIMFGLLGLEGAGLLGMGSGPGG